MNDFWPFLVGGPSLTMVMGGMGNYKPQQMDTHVTLEEEEEWNKRLQARVKKVGRRGGKRSRRKQRR